MSTSKTPKHVLVIAGPTGSGETTFTNELIEGYANMVRLTSATTRAPRLNEEHGKDYYFFSKEEFFNEVQKGNIIEHTFVPNRDAFYGSYKPDLDAKIAKGLIVIANTDLSGAEYFKANYDATTIFIRPKGLEVIADRLRRRDPSISDDEVAHRLKNAQDEIDRAQNHYDHVVWNTDGEFANTLLAVVDILKKEGYAVR
jgi:guanylate kinase